MADVVESLEVGCAGGAPPKDVGAVLFFLNLGRVDGFGFEGRGRRAKREPADKKDGSTSQFGISLVSFCWHDLI